MLLAAIQHSSLPAHLKATHGWRSAASENPNALLPAGI